MAEMKHDAYGELLCGMDEETLRLYVSLTDENKAKITRLIETLLSQQSAGQQWPDSSA